MSINGTQAREVFFKEFVSTLKRTINPKTGKNWFSEHGMDLRDDQDIQKRKVIFSPEDENNITAYSLDSEQYTGEGKNLLVVVFDEVGAFRVARAKELHTNLQDTQTSRFPRHSPGSVCSRVTPHRKRATHRVAFVGCRASLPGLGPFRRRFCQTTRTEHSIPS